MDTHMVLYREFGSLDVPLIFKCLAEDGDHAEEQCLDAYPEDEVLWVVEADTPEEAYASYAYSQGM